MDVIVISPLVVPIQQYVWQSCHSYMYIWLKSHFSLASLTASMSRHVRSVETPLQVTCGWHYAIQYGGVLYPVWSKTSDVSYDIQYGGILYPVWSKTDNVSYDIQYGGVLYPVWSKTSNISYPNTQIPDVTPNTQIHDVTPSTQIHDVTPNTQIHDVTPNTHIHDGSLSWLGRYP